MYCTIDEAWGKPSNQNIPRHYLSDAEYTEFNEYKKQKNSRQGNRAAPVTDKIPNDYYDIDTKDTNTESLSIPLLKESFTNKNIGTPTVGTVNDVETEIEQKKVIKQEIRKKLNSCNCDDILDHIHNCPDCLQKIYTRYNCIGTMDNSFLKAVLTQENKEKLTIVLTGILVILVLQLLKN